MENLIQVNFLKRTIVASDEWEKYKDKFFPTTMACVWEDGSDVYFVIKRDNKEFGGAALAHEVMHIVYALMRIIGQKPDAYNDEFEGYLIEWIYKELYDFTFCPKKCKKNK